MKKFAPFLIALVSAPMLAAPAQAAPDLAATLEICTRYAGMGIEARADLIADQGWALLDSYQQSSGESTIEFAEFKFNSAEGGAAFWTLNLRLLDFTNIDLPFIHECLIEAPVDVDAAAIFSKFVGEVVMINETEAENFGYSSEKITESRQVAQNRYYSRFELAPHPKNFINIERWRTEISAPWHAQIMTWVPQVSPVS